MRVVAGNGLRKAITLAALRDNWNAPPRYLKGRKKVSTGAAQFRLLTPNNLSFPGVDGQALLAALAQIISLILGSACTSRAGPHGAPQQLCA